MDDALLLLGRNFVLLPLSYPPSLSPFFIISGDGEGGKGSIGLKRPIRQPRKKGGGGGGGTPLLPSPPKKREDMVTQKAKWGAPQKGEGGAGGKEKKGLSLHKKKK